MIIVFSTPCINIVVCLFASFLADSVTYRRHFECVDLIECVGRHDAKVLYNKRHVTGSPFQLEMFDPTKVKLESAQTSGVVGDEMSLDSKCV